MKRHLLYLLVTLLLLPLQLLLLESNLTSGWLRTSKLLRRLGSPSPWRRFAKIVSTFEAAD